MSMMAAGVPLSSRIGVTKMAVDVLARAAKEQDGASLSTDRPGTTLFFDNSTTESRAKLRPGERRFLLGSGDLFAVNTALACSLALQFRESLVDLLTASPLWFIVLSCLWLVVAPAFGCYDFKNVLGRRSGTTSTLRAGALTIVIYFLVPYISAPLLYSRASMLTFAAAVLLLLGLWRIAYVGFASLPQFRTRALVLGAGWAGRTVVDAIRAGSSAEYDLVGFIDDDATKQDTSFEGLRVLGGSDSLMATVRAQEIQELILSITHNMSSNLHRELMTAFQAGIRIVPMHDVYEHVADRIAVEHIGDQWFVALPNWENGGLIFTSAKRLVDIVLGMAGTLAFLAAFPFIAAAIKLESPGPALYAQDRVGYRGRLFRVVKFRSMSRDAERGGCAVWASEHDPRVTRVGRALRATRLDELPQFLAILRGDMSLVGPRPERPEFVGELQEQIPFYRARLLVKPGLTGWAQVKHGYCKSVEDALIKLQYDLYYIKHQSAYLDLLILMRTIGVVLRRTGT